MRGASSALVVLSLVVAACGSTAASTTVATEPAPAVGSSTEASTESTAAAPAASTTVPAGPTTTSRPETTTTTDEPPLPIDPRTQAVVLVAEDDALNVRWGPGTEYDVVGSFEPTAVDIEASGQVMEAGGSVWVKVYTGDVDGWVNSFYVTPEWTLLEAERAWNSAATIEALTTIFESEGDLRPVASTRGLFVSDFGQQPQRWSPEELGGLLSDPTALVWSSTGCEDCVDATWSDFVAADFLQTYRDDDVMVGALDELLLGPGGPIAAGAIPIEFANFHYVAVHDPGDDPDFEGLDWTTWLVFLEYEGDGLRVVGLAVWAWIP